ncbi:MAG: DUF362 domain-containing protein [Pelolinea sp.]|nr:DUF362 domain-containing protein [Pelolinea sp.]
MSDEKALNRRDFLKKAGIAGAGLYLAGCANKSTKSLPTPFSEVNPETPQATNTPDVKSTQTIEPANGAAYLSVARGEDVAEITRRAIAAIGGIERFVKSGADVIIKPNICTDYYTYEYAATTNPIVVAALVSLAFTAGAARVRVMDNPFGGTAQSAYKRSGIKDAVNAAGGEMEVMNQNKFRKAEIPNGLDIKEWDFYKDILDADVVIDVPIAKNHGTTGLTLGAKNLMGTVLNRGQIHTNIHQRIADLVSRIKPALTVVDAVRILMRNGPTGGNLDDVKQLNTVIASADIVAADAYSATLFGMKGNDIGYIKAAAEMGLGTLDLTSIKIEEISV